MNDDVTTQAPPASMLVPDIEPGLPMLPQPGRTMPSADQRRPQVVRMDDREQATTPRPLDTGIFRSSPELDKFFEAFAKAQAKKEYGDIERTQKARIQSSRANYVIEYETLADVLLAVRPYLAEEGIAIMQMPFAFRSGQNTMVTIRTRLGHSSGQWIENELSTVVASQAPQDIGIGITYMCRYALKPICGVAPSSDDGTEKRLGEMGEAPKAAPRKSERQEPPPPQASAQPPASSPAQQSLAAAPVGTIKEIRPVGDKQDAWMVCLSTGFWFSTRDKEAIANIYSAKSDDETINVKTRASSNPERFAPVLVNFTIVPVGQP